ncbi:hypothetical protein [Paenibacillus sp. PAMC21692]|uniref:hypothetical protein n=1 Tax=Paenibacillus sp. PAMC21692 TaxID=2762320 RepID=UPI0021C44743|nr:hypothetical protein [Paenibacillus sp. PAMC21692]
MRRKTMLILLAIFVMASCFPMMAATANELEETGAAFYVSTDGSDFNAGTEAEPFLTLEKARDAIRALKQGSGLPDGGVTVYLRGGSYNRTGTFLLEQADSGTADKPITYKAYPGESVRLTGGSSLQKSWFTPVTNEEVLGRIISTEARSKVLQVDLSAHGITDYGLMSRHGYYLANDV